MSLPELLWLLGRVLLGGLFVVAGVRHFFIFDGVAQAVAARGVPWPRLVLGLGSAFQVVAGLLLVFGGLLMAAARAT